MSAVTTTAPARRLVVLSAGLSTPSSSRSLADRLARATTDALAVAGLPTATRTIELAEYAMDVTRHLLQGFASPALEDVLDELAAADGAIVVTPIFSASYSGVLKSFVDVLEPNWIEGLPVLIGATGGTERHSLALDFALRPLLAYQRAVVVPTGVFAATSDWGGTEGGGASGLTARVERAAAELAALVAADRQGRRATSQAPGSASLARRQAS